MAADQATLFVSRSGAHESLSKRLHFAPAPMLKTADRHSPQAFVALSLGKI
jgi:hypothetical protein